MPVQECTLNGKPGYRWGSSGRCYTYTPNDEASRRAAHRKAAQQGVAISYSQRRAGKKPDIPVK